MVMEMKRKEIVLTKETRKKEYVKRVMDAISPHLSLKSYHKVAIKINLSGQREIYANTNYESVESLIFYLKEHFGISDISVVEGSDGAFYANKSTWEIFYKFKYKEVELNGAKLVNLDELPHDQKLSVYTLNGIKEVSYTKCEADYLISVVPPKTHNIFPVHLSTLNMIGFVKPEDRILLYGACNTEIKKINSFKNDRMIQLSENGGKNFAKLLKEIPPSLTLIDGLFGMEGKGPIKGSPVFHGFALASEDTVLADALTTYIMGFEVDQVPYLIHAYREGLGNNRWQNIIGVDPSQVKFPYRPHPLFPKQKLWSEQYQQQRKGERIDRGDRSDRGERNDRYERSDRGERSYRGERSDRNDRENSTERMDRGERGNRWDRGDRGERKNWNDRGNRDNRYDRFNRYNRGDNNRADYNRVDKGDQSDNGNHRSTQAGENNSNTEPINDDERYNK